MGFAFVRWKIKLAHDFSAMSSIIVFSLFLVNSDRGLYRISAAAAAAVDFPACIITTITIMHTTMHMGAQAIRSKGHKRPPTPGP